LFSVLHKAIIPFKPIKKLPNHKYFSYWANW